MRGEMWGHLPGHDPYLGVTGDAESSEAKIAVVRPGSPAERYGLKPGDVVFGFDDRQIPDFASLKHAVSDCEPNEWVRIKVRRGNEIKTVGLRLDKQPE